MRHIRSVFALGVALLVTISVDSRAQVATGTRIVSVTKPSTGVSTLRFFNPLNTDGNLEVDLVLPSTGAVLATWKSKIAGHASPQMSIVEIENAAQWLPGAAKQTQYTIVVRSDFPGSVQHVAFRNSNLTDLTSCNVRKFSAPHAPVANVEAAASGLYPSYFYVTNKAATAGPERFTVYNAVTGSKIGQWTTADVRAGTTRVFTVFDIVSSLRLSGSSLPQMNLLREVGANNSVRHVAFNISTAMMTDLNGACFTTIGDNVGPTTVAAVPTAVGIDPFYKKYLNAAGLPVVASEYVSSLALTRARQLALRLTRQRPDVLLAMIAKGAYIAVVGNSETVSGQPDAPAGISTTQRSLGVSTPTARATFAAEENLLAWPTDTADLGNEAFVREFARSMLTQGLVGLDPAFEKSLNQAYAAASASPLYVGTSAKTNAGSYWAESVAAYFNAKKLVSSGNVLGHDIRTRAELQTHDPAMFTIVSDVYGTDPLPGGLLPSVVEAPPPGPEPVPSVPVLLSSLITEKARLEKAKVCSTTPYPAQWEWDPATATSQALPATAGTPKVEHVRNGRVVATYQYIGAGVCGGSIPQNAATNPGTVPANCGPFGRTAYRTWQPGDVFLVYPAVYSGEGNQPWIGPMASNGAEYSAGNFLVPANITIRGVTIGGVRPVIKVSTIGSTTLNQGAIYLDRSKDIVIENIDIDAEEITSVGKALVYVNGAQNLTLRDARIHGAARVKANGVFGTPNNSGTLKLERVDLYNNGGSAGPAHNVYINESTNDPNYTFEFLNSWSHASTYGHLLKSRAQITRVIGSYLAGGVPGGSVIQAEPYLVDVPNGGRFQLQNTVLVKNASGAGSNGIMVAYGMEGMPATRTHAVTIQNNTFAAFAKFYDGSHSISPMNFFYPAKIPGAADFPANVPLNAQQNVFSGFCDTNYPAVNYRGEQALTVALEELNKDYSLRTKYAGNDAAVIGTPAYDHRAQAGVRAAKTIGARD